jgi:hypothetical protein
MGYRLQYRRDTAARWAEINPILLDGEIGYVKDNPNQYKMGDGSHAWNDLPLRGFNGTIAPTFGYNDDAVLSQRIVTEKFEEQDLKLSEIGSEVGVISKGIHHVDEIILRGESLKNTIVTFNFEQVVSGSGAIGLFDISGERIGLVKESAEVIIPNNFSYASILWGDLLFVDEVRTEKSNDKMLGKITNIESILSELRLSKIIDITYWVNFNSNSLSIDLNEGEFVFEGNSKDLVLMQNGKRVSVPLNYNTLYLYKGLFFRWKNDERF